MRKLKLRVIKYLAKRVICRVQTQTRTWLTPKYVSDLKPGPVAWFLKPEVCLCSWPLFEITNSNKFADATIYPLHYAMAGFLSWICSIVKTRHYFLATKRPALRLDCWFTFLFACPVSLGKWLKPSVPCVFTWKTSDDNKWKFIIITPTFWGCWTLVPDS